MLPQGAKFRALPDAGYVFLECGYNVYVACTHAHMLTRTNAHTHTHTHTHEHRYFIDAPNTEGKYVFREKALAGKQYLLKYIN